MVLIKRPSFLIFNSPLYIKKVEMSKIFNHCLLTLIIISCFWAFMPFPILYAESAGNKSPYKIQELLVKFTSKTNESSKNSIRDKLGATLIKTIRSIQIEYWRLPNTITTEEALKYLNELPVVEHVEPNYLYSPQMVPNDIHFNKQWFLRNSGQDINGYSGAPDADISAIEAWEIETGSSNVIIAVIDSGVAYDHPDLINNVWTNHHEIMENGLDDDLNGYVDDIHGWDFVNDNNNPSDYSRDLYGDGHGTHVAGIIAAQGNNGIGVSGIMWHAQIMPLQVFDLYETSSFRDAFIQNINIISAIEYAVDNGAWIINCSFGSSLESQFQYEVLNHANQHGVLVVVAAGNESNNNDTIPIFPANWDLPNIISVAATDGLNNLSSYSNYGKNTVDVAAPGGDHFLSIYSTVPPKREILFYENFESGDEKWTKGGIFEDWSSVFNPLFDSCVVQDSAASYHNEENSYIQLINPIHTRNYKGLNIQFKSLYMLENNYDFLFLEGSTDGINFSTVFPITGYVTGFSNKIQTLFGWGDDLRISDRFYLRFRLQSDQFLNYDGVYIDDIKITGIYWNFEGDEYDNKIGTSMAAPVVSGIAGLIWSYRPSLTHMEVKDTIINSVDKMDSLTLKVLSGGRVNAANALKAFSGASDFYETSKDGEVELEKGCFIFSLMSR